MTLSLREQYRALEPRDAARLLNAAGLSGFPRRWAFRARPEQLAPAGDWRTWLVMAGRGWGKTRCGAEWVLAQARAHPRCHIALTGATMAEARAVMVEGESGLLACARPADELLWAPSLDRLRWGNGSEARLFSAADPEGLRGPTHDFAWADEIGKWGGERGVAAWDNLMLTMRSGDRPRAIATTTPRPVPLIKRLLGDAQTVVTRGSTHENADNLSPAFVAEMNALYGGTRLGRQELDGELIEDVAGALWTRAMIEGCRAVRWGNGEWGGGSGARDRGLSPLGDCPLIDERGQSPSGDSPQWIALPTPHSPLPPLSTRVVVAVDPPASSTGDACGIVACGVDHSGHGYVLEDASVEGASPERWARAVAACAARWNADRVIAEANNGGAMVRSTLLTHDRNLPVKLVHASRGKGARAEPVALLYEAGRISHAGVFPELEDQLCGMTPGGYAGPGRSPDRADALVWAFNELMLSVRAEPRVRRL